MNIVLLSTAIEDKLFSSLNEQGKAPNPSGQNFYLRLFASLEKVGEVNAYSLVGYTDSLNSVDPRFHYLFPPKGKLARLGFANKIARLLLEENEKKKIDVIFYDSLNLTIAKAIKTISKSKKIKLIAVCTDDPHNISYAPKYYAPLCLRTNRYADGYFCLTEGLNRLFNLSKKPHYLQMGIVDNPVQTGSPLNKPYLYFGGALFEKDGVGDLVDAFLEVKPEMDLFIAGHGPMDQELAKKNEKSLHFLGQISKEEHLRYVSHAFAVINPRRYNASLDEVSVPSKVLEYIALCPRVVSTLSTPIKKAYGDDIIWLEGGTNNKDALKSFFERLSSLSPSTGMAQKRIIADLGIEATATHLKQFIERVL